jgi:hypothetical protein
MESSVKKKIKDMTEQEFREYKNDKQKERRKNLSEEEKNRIKLNKKNLEK